MKRGGAGGAVAGTALAILWGTLSACSEGPRRDVPPVVDAHGLDVETARLGPRLNLLNFPEYVDPELLREFEDTYGVRVVQDFFDTNEAMMAKLRAGGTGQYDLVVASDYAVGILAEQDLLEVLDLDNVPNRRNLDPRFLEMPFDPENRWSLCYQWGTTGFGVRTDMATAAGEALRTWGVLFDPEAAAGRFAFLDDARETLGAALLYLGHSVNTVDPGALEEAGALLARARGRAVAFTAASTGRDLLLAGEVVVSHNHSGDVAAATLESEHVEYVIPREGAVIWTDNMVVPRGAPNRYAAEVFMNFMLDPENGARLSNETRYASPNRASLPFLDPELRDDPGVYPDSATLARLEFIRDVGEARRLYDRVWTRVKAGG